jgi:DNA polymerase I
MDHLVLVDASAYIFRAFHALPPLTRKSDGVPIGAVSGFCNMLWKLLEEIRDAEHITHVGIVFDPKGGTFRDKIYDKYKANRPPAPADLIPQFPLVREATRAFGLPVLEIIGYEADDVIATYARLATESGMKTTIFSSDKDLMQLVNDHVFMYDPMKERRIGAEQVFEKFGVTPLQVIDVQALMGDSTDNVPGVPGVGAKTATALIAEYGSLDAVLEAAPSITKPKLRESLINNADLARISKALVTLETHVPVETPIEELILHALDQPTVLTFLKGMEFTTLTRRVAGAKTAAPIESPKQHLDQTPFNAGDYKALSTLFELETWVQQAREQGYIAFDTETTSLDIMQAELLGVSLALTPGKACYVPFGHRDAADLFSSGKLHAGQMPLNDALPLLKCLLEDESILKIGQNIKYDMGVMANYDISIVNIDDTMLLSYALDVGRGRHGMDYLAEKHLSYIPMSYDEVTKNGKVKLPFAEVSIEKATHYAAEDADVTLRLWKLFKARLISEKKTSVYETLERGMPAVLSRMERRGVRVDREVLSRLSGEFAQIAARKEAEIHELAGESFNVGSPKQIGEILYDKLGLKGGSKTKTGQWSTSASELEDLAESGQPIARAIIDYRTVAKLKSTYTDALPGFINMQTKRVHTSFSLASTSTGRLSSSEPNVQNIPIRTEEGRKIRTAFIAAEGCKLVSADYSQIELRLLAHIADIPQLKRAFADNIDIHAMTASEMFGVPIEGMDSSVRRRAKAINFGIIYGISAFGLANQLGISREEAGAYIKKYFERFPGIQDYMVETKRHARENGYVSTIFGRHCFFPSLQNGSAAEKAFMERAAINAPIQGSAADIMRRAMLRMEDALLAKGLKAQMLLQVHDELIFDVPESELERTIPVIKQVMEHACEPALNISVPLPVEAKSAMNWDEAH